MNRRAAALAIALSAAAPLAARAQSAPAKLVQLAPPPAAASGASGSIDPGAATRAYLARQSSAEKARSDAYFEGGYWLDLWSFLWAAAVYVVLLHTGVSAKMRDLSERLTHIRPLQIGAYWVQFVVALAVMSLPLTVYRDYVREHRYGLSNLTFSAWLGELGKGLALTAVLGGLAMMILYAVVRRLPRTWWLWGSVATVALSALFALIVPIFIVPVFNSPQRLTDQRVVAPILSLARASGIQAHDVWEVDASKQSKRISANVSGLFGTERITLNDNLLKRASPAAIQAVMGHEMGHYVLNHAYKMLVSFSVLIAIGFGLVGWVYPRLAARYRNRWRIEGIADPAGLPLITLILMLYLFALTPLVNTIIRTNEYEADIFGLNAARQPDGFAEAALLLSDYRKLAPGPIEEIIFFDHPSGHTRIFTAMRWKAEQPR